jgi:hypothetical protein
MHSQNVVGTVTLLDAVIDYHDCASTHAKVPEVKWLVEEETRCCTHCLW